MLNALYETMCRTGYFLQLIQPILKVTKWLQRKRIIKRFNMQLKTF